MTSVVLRWLWQQGGGQQQHQQNAALAADMYRALEVPPKARMPLAAAIRKTLGMPEAGPGTDARSDTLSGLQSTHFVRVPLPPLPPPSFC